MQPAGFFTHVIDIFKAAAAVALVQAVISFLHYVGVHIDTLANVGASIGGGFAAIKIHFT